MTNTNAVESMVERLEPETTTEVQVFKYRGVNPEHSVYTVRCVIGEDGEPLFVAADVCRVLELERSQDSVRYLDDDEKGMCLVNTPSGKQSMTVITEA